MKRPPAELKAWLAKLRGLGQGREAQHRFLVVGPVQNLPQPLLVHYGSAADASAPVWNEGRGYHAPTEIELAHRVAVARGLLQEDDGRVVSPRMLKNEIDA